MELMFEVAEGIGTISGQTSKSSMSGEILTSKD
jgi:hypothetical protein